MKYSQVLQTDYHTSANFRKNDVTFEPDKIRESLGYARVVKEISNTDMDGQYKKKISHIGIYLTELRFL